MSTAGIDPNMAHSIAMLQKQSMKVEFHLEHTDYQKVENIGTGAYGVVCSAVNKKTKQRVAIKKIPNIFTMDPRYALRTYREIKILQHFRHDNIIAIREILQSPKKDQTDIYVVMDLMESDLHRIIYSKQELTDEHIKYFLYQILRGLKYIHSAHVVHRDLKPSNLLVNADCELKIGDFGMARGINFVAAKSNTQQVLTQYVATRWYRAPELIVSARQNYGAAIDMWSVGCIFAELLRRKHLFPGRDLLKQLEWIFKTLGIPSQSYLDSLDSETVCGFLKKIAEMNKGKQKTCAELCPKASIEAVDLLSKMLMIEPDKRISVEDALAHPFLAKYHDVMFEPKCRREFDFSFEQDLSVTSPYSDEQKRTKLQELIRKEVIHYRKPTLVDFGSLIQTKSATSNAADSTKDDPYADLNAFLAKLASPVAVSGSNASSTTSVSQASVNPLLGNKGNPLLANQGNSLLANQGNSLLANQGNPLLANQGNPNQGNPLLVNQGNPLLTKQRNPLLAKEGNPLLANRGDPAVPGSSCEQPRNSLLGAQRANQLLLNQPNALINKGIGSTQAAESSIGCTNMTSHADNPLLVTNTTNGDSLATGKATSSFTQIQRTVENSESDHSNDVDLFKALEQRSNRAADVSKGTLQVETTAKGGEDDIEMLSAKLEQAELDDNTRSNFKLMVDTLAKPSNDDIEMLSSKLDRANVKEELQSKVVDAKTRLRQRLIEQQSKKPTSVPVSQSLKTSAKPVVTAYQRQKERKEMRKQRELKALKKKRKKNQTDDNSSSHQLLTTEDQRMLERWKKMAKPHSIQPKPPATITSEGHSSQASLVTSAATNNIIVVYPTAAHTTYVTTSSHATNMLPTTQIAIGQALVPPGQLMTNNPHTQVMIVQQSSNSQPSTLSHAPPAALPQSQTPMLSQRQPSTLAQGHQYQPDYMLSYNRDISQPVRSFTDLAMQRMASQEGNLLEEGQETSFYDLGHLENTNDSNSFHSNNAGNNNLATQQSMLANWSNHESVITTLDLGSLMKPKTNGENLPMKFVSTPKGTGAGYGVGFDIESMIDYSNSDTLNVQMDSAPLSASLLADWMDVTGNMDPQALEEIQQELNSALIDDFPFTNY